MTLMRITALAGLLASPLLLGGCFEQSTAFERSLGKQVQASRLQPYRADSPYADVLEDCMAIEAARDSCTINQLPPMGWPNNEVPDVDDIMDRVLVSHDWMGERFEVLLREMPDDMLYLFRSLTVITLSADIRPSRYSAWRAAMFIDPNHLWLTPEERQQIDLSPDYRSDFGADLQFVHLWRHVKDNDYAIFWVPPSAGNVSPRELDDIYLSVARVLYHELAHAVDYMSPDRIAGLNGGERMAFSAFNDVSNELDSRFPLSSALVRALAQVRFMGETATESQQQVSASEVAEEFASDVAVAWYNYATIREDQAMLFEALMVYHHFGVQRDMAFAAREDIADNSLDTVITWGQRNRVGDPAIQPRLRLILEMMMPEVDPDDYLNDISPPVDLVPGASWRANLDPETLDPEVYPEREVHQEMPHAHERSR